MPRSRYAYGPWHGGPDPLARPLNLRAAMDEIGRDVMEGSSVRSALRELLRRGLPGERGLDDLMSKVWRRRRELTRNNRLDGTLRDVKRLLDRALTAERETLAADPSEDARFQEMELDTLPDSTPQAVRQLQPYEWRSSDAREAYEEIQRLMGQEMLESRFKGMKEALQQTTPQDVERVREMLDDLNALLAAHAQDDPAIDDKFRDFIDKHGQFFPENPRNVEELIDSLAARAAAAQRMLNSMSAEQRAELAELAAQAFGDERLAASLGELDARLRAARPGEDWESGQRFRGQGQGMGLGEGTQAMQDLADLDALAEELSQDYPGAELEDVDLDALADQLGEDAAVDLQRLRELERELARQGLLNRGPDGSLLLSPKAMRRLGQTVLSDLLGDLTSRQGEHEDPSLGAAGETTGATRPWVFGDVQPFATGATVRNAVLRGAAEGRPMTGGVQLGVDDIEVMETERRTQAVVALCVDTSWSMVTEGRWVPMKRTALALHHLVETRFRGDALALIGFGRYAQSLQVGELAALEGAYEQGTNLHHALLLAHRHLRRHPNAEPVVMVVTDGEPTAHLEPDGESVFDYPPRPDTLGKTLRAVDDLARMGASTTLFRLGDEPRLRRFVEVFARRSHGRVVAPDLDGLGPAVVTDYLRTRRRGRR